MGPPALNSRPSAGWPPTESEMDHSDLHPIELIAHQILSGPLDNLNDNFESLHNSQVILLTRLKSIEQRLTNLSIQSNDKVIDIQEELARIKVIRKRLQSSQKKLGKIDKRLEGLQL